MEKMEKMEKTWMWWKNWMWWKTWMWWNIGIFGKINRNTYRTTRTMPTHGIKTSDHICQISPA